MKSFHKKMSFLFVVFLIMVISSSIFAAYYMGSNHITPDTLFGKSISLNYNGNWQIGGIFRDSKQSSDYDTMDYSESTNYDLKPELFISSTIEEVFFFEEERDDILIEYIREYPETENYVVGYTSEVSSDKISVFTSLSVKDLTINRDYPGYINVYVPDDYHFEKITIDTGAAKIRTENVFQNTDALVIIASFGDIDLTLDKALDLLSIDCSTGEIKVDIQESIQEVDIKSSLGVIQVDTHAQVDDLHISDDAGDIILNARDVLRDVSIDNSMGSVYAMFKEDVSSVNINGDLGKIEASFYENDKMQVYVDTDLGSSSSDFPQIDSPSDFNFTTSLGNISIEKK